MRQKTEHHKCGAERATKEPRRQTQIRYSAEEKIRIVQATPLATSASIWSACAKLHIP